MVRCAPLEPTPDVVPEFFNAPLVGGPQRLRHALQALAAGQTGAADAHLTDAIDDVRLGVRAFVLSPRVADRWRFAALCELVRARITRELIASSGRRADRVRTAVARLLPFMSSASVDPDARLAAYALVYGGWLFDVRGAHAVIEHSGGLTANDLCAARPAVAHAVLRSVLHAGLVTGDESALRRARGLLDALPSVESEPMALVNDWYLAWSAQLGWLDGEEATGIDRGLWSFSGRRAPEPFVRMQLEAMRKSWQDHEWGPGLVAARRLVLWHGDVMPLDRIDAPAVNLEPAASQRVMITSGQAVPVDALPPESIALDGVVRGALVDVEGQRYSFDSRAGGYCTASSSQQVLDALNGGLDPRPLTVHIGGLGADTLLATWLLLRPEAARLQRVVRAVREAARRRALGPFDDESGLHSGIDWALRPAEQDGRMDPSALRASIDECFWRLDRWCWLGDVVADGAPRQDEAVDDLVVLHDEGHWLLVESASQYAFPMLYQRGVDAGIVCSQLRDGTWMYTVGKKSEFVRGFHVRRIVEALAAAEWLANPAQLPVYTWGVTASVGGSPRNPDGSSSHLTPSQVVEVVQDALSLPAP